MRIAIPDFYLPETNTIIEIKSSWTLDKQNMIDKRNSYINLNYNFKLILEHQEIDIFSFDETKKKNMYQYRSEDFNIINDIINVESNEINDDITMEPLF